MALLTYQDQRRTCHIPCWYYCSSLRQDCRVAEIKTPGPRGKLASFNLLVVCIYNAPLKGSRGRCLTGATELDSTRRPMDVNIHWLTDIGVALVRVRSH